MEKNGIWEERWKVAAFMVDTNQRIRLKSLADIFQELANNHANYRQCGFEDMKASGKFWVLNRQIIELNEWPIWEQSIKVESWISMMKGPFSLRHFALYNDHGDIMVKASYLWTSIDKEKMEPAAIPNIEFPIIEHRAFDLPQPSKIKVMGPIITEHRYRIRDSDLDIIGHTNNAVYLEWASNILKESAITYRKIEANYTGESFAGQEVVIRLLGNEGLTPSLEVLNHEAQKIFKLRLHQ